MAEIKDGGPQRGATLGPDVQIAIDNLRAALADGRHDGRAEFGVAVARMLLAGTQ